LLIWSKVVGCRFLTQWGSGIAHLVGRRWLFDRLCLCAGLASFPAERGWDRRLWTTLLAMILGNLVIYAFGVGWLSTFLGVGTAWLKGCFLFIGDVIKFPGDGSSAGGWL